MYRDPALAELLVKGHHGEDLREVERTRYNAYLSTIFEAHQTFFIQHVKGTVSDELWDFYSGTFDRHMQAPGILQWWQRNRSSFNPGIAAYIEEKVRDGA